MLKEMKYVYEVYQKRSFSKAAESLFISQPALSAMIKKLERELGTPLFDRSTNPIQITPAGEYYIQSIEEIMNIEKNMYAYFNNLQNLTAGSLTISTGTFFCSYSLPILLKPFINKYPKIEINLLENHIHTEMEQLLKSGKADFALSSNPEPFKNYEKQFFIQEHLILVIPKRYSINDDLKDYQFTYQDILDGKHTKTDSPKVSLKHFKNQPFLSLQQGSDLYHRSQLMFQNIDVTPQIYMYLGQMPTAYYMTWHGYGYSIIRDSTLHIVPTESAENVVFYKIDDPLAIRNIYFYFRNPRHLSQVAQKFLSYVQETCKIPGEQ